LLLILFSMGKSQKKQELPAWVWGMGAVVLLFGGVYALGKFAMSQGYGAQPESGLSGAGTGEHWHADYTFTACGDKRDTVPVGPGEVHSHGDHRIHVHPQSPATSGRLATLNTFFRTHGGSFSEDSIEYPGDGRTWRNGDECPDGSAGTLSMTVNGEARTDAGRYIPQDGDVIDIRFE
jgi:hypothetical protein